MLYKEGTLQTSSLVVLDHSRLCKTTSHFVHELEIVTPNTHTCRVWKALISSEPSQSE